MLTQTSFRAGSLVIVEVGEAGVVDVLDNFEVEMDPC